MKPKVALVRGKFLNKYEMQFFEPLTGAFDVTAFGSLSCYHDRFAFPTVKLPSPMDVPDFPYKMPMLNRLLVDAQYLFGLEEKLKGFDLVHTAETYFSYTQQCLNAKRKGYVRKVIATVLENIPFNNEGISGRKEFKQRARKELDHIIALTQKTRHALLAEGADPKKITVIPHFVDTSRFTQARQAVARKKKEFTILFCGRLETYKGVYEVLHAAKKLLHDTSLKGYRLSFVLVGDGSQKNALKKLEQTLGIDRFIGHLVVSYEDMPKMYHQADIFVAPSKPTPTWEEQYCTVLLEAQASGLPIVTTKTGGIPENIGDAGLVIEPGNVNKLAEAIKRFIIDEPLRITFAKKARNRAEKTHDIHIGAKKLAQLYRMVLA